MPPVIFVPIAPTIIHQPTRREVHKLVIQQDKNEPFTNIEKALSAYLGEQVTYNNDDFLVKRKKFTPFLITSAAGAFIGMFLAIVIFGMWADANLPHFVYSPLDYPIPFYMQPWFLMPVCIVIAIPFALAIAELYCRLSPLESSGLWVEFAPSSDHIFIEFKSTSLSQLLAIQDYLIKQGIQVKEE